MCGHRQRTVKANNRRKIFETICLFWVFVLIGFDNGILGPCLPDLQSLVGTSLERMSFIFFVQGTGFLLGTVTGFLLDKRADRRLLLGLYVLVGSVVNILIPLVPSFYYLLALFLLQGVTKGQADFGAMSLCNVLWKEDKALPFQFIVVGASLSTFISPFIAQPFISAVPSALTSHNCQGHHVHNENWTRLSLNDSDLSIHSISNHSDLQFGLMSNESESKMYSMSNDTRTSWTSFTDTNNIRWAFFIVGSITLPASLVFFCFYFTRTKWQHSSVIEPEKILVVKSDVDETTNLLATISPTILPNHTATTTLSSNSSSRSVFTFRLSVVLLNFPVFGLLLTFGDLLTSIGMTSPLCMTVVEASYFNTVLWGAKMIGRVTSAAVLTCVPISRQLLFNTFALVLVGMMTVIGDRESSLTLWLGAGGVALLIAPAMPGFMAWSNDYVPMTPSFINLCLCASGLGEMLLPFLGGQLMARFGTWYLLLFVQMIMISMLVLFLLAAYVARNINRL